MNTLAFHIDKSVHSSAARLNTGQPGNASLQNSLTKQGRGSSSPRAKKVGFILFNHFSMVTYTAAIDTLVTANLVTGDPLFEITSYGVASTDVTCDLGVTVSTDGNLRDLHTESLDMILVCGGYRSSLTEQPLLSKKLRMAKWQGKILGGLWNGVIALAYAGVTGSGVIALHPSSLSFMAERFKDIKTSGRGFQIDEQIMTCSGPNSAIDMLLYVIKKNLNSRVSREITRILLSDCLPEIEPALESRDDRSLLPESLKTMIQLMHSNIEEPLTLDELVAYCHTCKRKIQRQFQKYLNTSPCNYYIQVRLEHARQLLMHSNYSITMVGMASGFTSPSHFSRRFKQMFGISPAEVRKKYLLELSEQPHEQNYPRLSFNDARIPVETAV
ncbi:GlxA family transcriptional regulator [Hahella ganghwensis]|uniref:GlxA family transcriptional regulator n=1 Tax=Hahella ganghwensis TaxID=286420 RepID=UPI00037DBB78|nr:helix-turn-helix domain-containing protein [Hahella ganghwensis]